MSLKSEKMHSYFTEKALDYAMFDLIGPWGEYHIDDTTNDIYYDFKEEKVKDLESLEFTLPSIEEIKKIAKKKYYKFDGSSINKIIYRFMYLDRFKLRTILGNQRDFKLVAKDSDIVLDHSLFNSINIKSGGSVEIFDCSSNFDININAPTVKISGCSSLGIMCNTNINSEYAEFNNVHLIKNLNINSKLIVLNNLSMTLSDNIVLNADMIDSKNSELKAQNKIVITNTNCDEIKGVDAPIIIYNGQDITYSDDIVMPKLRKNLLEVLYKVKHKVSTNLDNEIKIKTEKIKEELNNKPFTKILKK